MLAQPHVAIAGPLVPLDDSVQEVRRGPVPVPDRLLPEVGLAGLVRLLPPDHAGAHQPPRRAEALLGALNVYIVTLELGALNARAFTHLQLEALLEHGPPAARKMTFFGAGVLVLVDLEMVDQDDREGPAVQPLRHGGQVAADLERLHGEAAAGVAIAVDGRLRVACQLAHDAVHPEEDREGPPGSGVLLRPLHESFIGLLALQIKSDAVL